MGALAVGGGFDPGSAHLGIIAILIGLITQPVPSLSYQVGEELFVSAFDSTGFRPVARQTLTPGASGLMEDEGIFYFMLPFIEQDNVYRAFPGGTPELVLELPR